MLNFDRRRTVLSPSPPSTPRLRWGPKQERRALLDGAWWPRSNDPVAELPGLVLALDHRRGPVTRVMLGHPGWSSRPLRLAVASRVIRLGWFTSLPAGLLTAICADRDRVDLLVIPPDTDPAVADAAMALAADPTNTVHTPDIVATAAARLGTRPEAEARNRWESEGGHLRTMARPQVG